MGNAAPTQKFSAAPKSVAPLRVQCKKAGPKPRHDPWEDEAEELAEWLARSRSGTTPIAAPAIHPVPFARNDWGTPVDPVLVSRAQRSSGRALDAPLREDFERQLGHDLHNVRVHDDPESRALARSLDAEAFTLGQHIFTTSTDRELLAHEVVHTVQQRSVAEAAPVDRIQAAFEKTTAELDPKVEILLDLHLRSKSKQLKTIVTDKLLVADSWWLKLRAKLEDKNPTVAVVAKDEVEVAIKAIGEYASLDTAHGDPIQNGVAGLLADYLRINDAPELAAFVTVAIPWLRTAVPAQEVIGALIAEKKLAPAAMIALPGIWARYKPKGATAATWTEDITQAVDQFLTLAPLADHAKSRQALIDRLDAPLRPGTEIPGAAKAGPAFDRLTAKNKLQSNELDAFAWKTLTVVRTLWAALLLQRVRARETETSSTPLLLWELDVIALEDAVRRSGTPEDSALKVSPIAAINPVILKAQELLKKELTPAIETHTAFWAELGRSIKYDTPSEADKFLKLKLGDMTYAQLFFAADQGALATQLQDIVQPLADAAKAYFDLFGGTLPALEERTTVLKVYGRHRELADAFRAILRDKIIVSVVRKLQLARTAGRGDVAHGLGWFALKLQGIHNTLEKSPPIDESSKPSDLITVVESRDGVARTLWELARDALGKTGADIYASVRPLKERTEVKGKDNVPAAATWQALMDRAAAAFAQNDIKTGVLVLRTGFQESQRTGLDQLATDVAGPDLVQGLEPFTGSDLVKFYSMLYYRSFERELTALTDEAGGLEANQQPRVKEDLWLVQRANDSLKAGDDLPRRFASRDVYWSSYALDHPRAFGRLLDQQKFFRDFRSQYETRSNVVLSASRGPDENQDAWAWTLPLPGELLKPLYSVDLLRGLAALPVDELTAALAQAQPTDETVADKNRATNQDSNTAVFEGLLSAATEAGRKIRANVDPAEGYYNWYARLNSRARSIREKLQGDFLQQDAVAKTREKTVEALATGLPAARATLHLAQRRATTMDRRVIRRINRELFEAAIDNRLRNHNAIGFALDNHDTFRAAVTPREPKREIQLQSAALVLDDAELWLKMMEDARPVGSFRRRAYTVLSEAVQWLPSLLDRTTERKSHPIDLAADARGIAWETDFERQQLEKRIAEVTPKFRGVLDAMMAEMLPIQWDLGITGRRSEGDPAHAALISHLSPGSEFQLKTVASIQAANAAEKDPDEHRPEFYGAGPFAMKIIRVHQDFTFLPGIGDRETASADWQSEHALYQKARVFVGTAARDRSDLEKLNATAMEDPKLAFFDARNKEKGPALVDVELWEGETLFSKFTVHAGELEGTQGAMNWLAGVVHSNASQKKFASMAADIEMFGNALLFAASLYPPTALAVTAAELLAAFGKIATDPEFKEAVEAIAHDPIESVKHAADELKAQFTVGRLFDLLLNGNFEADRFLGAATLRGKKRSNKLTQGRIAKVLTRVKRVGAVFAVQLEHFQEGVQGPVHRIENAMSQHPRLATMMEWLSEHLHDMGDPEGMILKHPYAGPVYEAYARYRMLGQNAAGEDTIGQPLQEVATNLQSGLDRMAHFELPATIIPLDLAIEALFDIALKIAPKNGKIGMVFRGIAAANKGLKATGANSVVYGFLADQIADSWIDPNHYWKTDVVPLLEPPMQAVIQSAAESISTNLARAPLIGDYFGNDRVKGAKIPIPPGGQAKLPNGNAASTAKITISDDLDHVFDSPQVEKLAPDDSGKSEGREVTYADIRTMPDAFFEGIQKKPAATNAPGGAAGDANAPSGSPSPLTSSAAAVGAPSPSGHPSSPFAGRQGAPLAPAQRSDAERKFGHSFSHVRLHQGPDAWAATVPRGADALTSGRDVFLRPDLSPRSGRGQRIMDHELAHVLQKTTGASAAASRPTAGGVRWRPSEENAANRMADQARHNPGRAPVPVACAHRDGASPSIGLDLMETFFKKLSSPSAGSSLATAIDKAHKRHPAADISPESLAAANGIWSSIQTSLRGVPSVASQFKVSAPKIKAHLDNRLSTLTRGGESVPAASKVIAHIAALNEQDAPAAPGAKPTSGGTTGTAPAKAKPTFDAKGFLADLSLYITGRSGIVFDFDLSEAEHKKLKTDPNATVSVAVKVKHIELLFVSSLSEAGLKLWDASIANTVWKRTDDPKARRDALRKVLESEFHGAAPESTTADDTTAPKPAATGGPAPKPADTSAKSGSYTPIWDTSKPDLTLNDTYREKVETQLSPAELSSNLMPSWGYFAAPATPTEKLETVPGAPVSQVGKNAVHWKGKTHGEFTSGTYFLDENRRNSHHIVQYLLPEYFANIKEFQPFPKLGPARNYPGVKPTGTKVDTIAGDNQTIGVAKTETGSRRGHAMPAILLSATTHQNAGLHVTPEPDDLGKASQGYAIHREFRKFLSSSVTSQLGVTREGDALDDYLVGLGTGNTKGQAAVVAAVRQTYAWLKQQNETNLFAPSGMPKHEAEFYVSQFRASDEGKKNFKTLTGHDYETGVEGVRTRIQTRLQTEARTAFDAAIAALAEAPLGWKLPGA